MSRMDCGVCLDACFGTPPPPGPPSLLQASNPSHRIMPTHTTLRRRRRSCSESTSAGPSVSSSAQAPPHHAQLRNRTEAHESHTYTYPIHARPLSTAGPASETCKCTHTYNPPSKTKPNSPNSLFLEFSHKDLREMMTMTMQPSRRVYPKRHTCPKRLNITARYKQILPSCQASIRNKKD